MKKYLLTGLLLLLMYLPSFSVITTLNLNSEKEYFEAQGFTLLAFHNNYPEGKQGGLEIIQHDQRLASCGDLRLEPTPGQWDPKSGNARRSLDAQNKIIHVTNTFPAVALDYSVHIRTENGQFIITLDLAKPLPDSLAGKLGFNFELYPQIYFGKSYCLDGTFNTFPRQGNGPVQLHNGEVIPQPLASGHNLSVAPEDPLYHLQFESKNGTLQLYDGRDTDQNGWYVIRQEIPAGATQNAIEWVIQPFIAPDWRHIPVIGHSQVGYHPNQVKQAIIELDAQTVNTQIAGLYKVANGGLAPVLEATPKLWGKFLRYQYAIFDFSQVREPGMYVIRYGDRQTEPFKISADVYQQAVWQSTLDTFFPVQMCHTTIRDRFRIWHGPCHLDDAMQAPAPLEHFDSYRQGAATETKFQPFEHVPGLDRGGWHDAGDYDLAAGSQARTIYSLVLIRETFKVNTDQTAVNDEARLVELHKPDGAPDILQQIRHGLQNLLAGYRISDHCFPGIICNSIIQYVHLGDAMTMTDNLVYEPKLGPLQTDGFHSGKKDDRYIFTNKSTGMEYSAAATFAASARVLRGFDDKLADECLHTAIKIWDYEQTHEPVMHRSAYIPGNIKEQEILATVELYETTKNEKYLNHLVALLPDIKKQVRGAGWAITRILPAIKDPAFTSEFAQAVNEYSAMIQKSMTENPYGIPYRPAIWGVGWDIQSFAVNQYYLHKAYPALFDRENVLRALNFIFGCHPGSSTSFISGVGARSLTTAYGVNRDDWSYIPGGGASGTGLIRPDFPELKDPFPYLWQQGEYVMPGAASYIFCVLAADDLLNGK
ncbi:MAG TPA: glycoside hydrolase family 9 protein [bacterium]|nr:glycoside hydrolase family 9 protein [bacterium]HPN42460.1 glycoside hydrolase family 9 protein [bacterium]